MSFLFKSTCNITGIKVFENKAFNDNRGCFIESYNKNDINKLVGKKINFIQDCFSISKKKVLRGIHAEPYQSKIVSCIEGQIYLVFVNLNKNSKNYYKHKSFKIDAHKKKLFFFVPKNTGIGHQVLSNHAIFHYKVNGYYTNKYQKTIKWDDNKLNIKWPYMKPILSKRDRIGKYV